MQNRGFFFNIKDLAPTHMSSGLPLSKLLGGLLAYYLVLMLKSSAGVMKTKLPFCPK